MLYVVRNTVGEIIAYTNDLPTAESWRNGEQIDKTRYSVYVVRNGREILLTEKSSDPEIRLGG